VPFSVGAHQAGLSLSTYLVIAVLLMGGGYLGYLSSPAFQRAVDRVLKKAT
jgi:hypothetical protein